MRERPAPEVLPVVRVVSISKSKSRRSSDERPPEERLPPSLPNMGNQERRQQKRVGELLQMERPSEDRHNTLSGEGLSQAGKTISPIPPDQD